jgi:hypothetical protein
MGCFPGNFNGCSAHFWASSAIHLPGDLRLIEGVEGYASGVQHAHIDPYLAGDAIQQDRLVMVRGHRLSLSLSPG